MSDESARPVAIIADDEDLGRLLLAETAVASGLTPLSFDNGAEALKGALAQEVAIVLLDVDMPGMDGYAVCRRLRAEARFATVPIVMVTGHEDSVAISRAFDAGATELLVATRDLSLTSHHPNPGLANVLERYMREIVARLPKDDSLIERARGTIAEQMRKSCGTRPSLEVTSKELHMSPRSVQRRLREHGTTHQDLVESVRRDMAERLVLDRRLSITEIAFLLGFEDVSGFRRAYERWTGTTPARARGRSRSVAPPAP